MLHPDCERRLIDVLSEAIGDATFYHGMFLPTTRPKGLQHIDDILPRATRDKYAQYISERPLADFVMGEMQSTLYRAHRYDSDSTLRPLTVWPEFAEPTAAARRLLAEFIALPRDYTLLAEVPIDAMPPETLADPVPLGPDLALVSGTALAATLPRTSDEEPDAFLSSLRTSPFAEWRSGTTYVQGRRKGYVADLYSTRTVEDMQSIVRSFVGLAEALLVVDVRSIGFGTPPSRKVLVYEHTTSSKLPRGEHDFAATDSVVLSSLKVRTANEPTWSPRFGLTVVGKAMSAAGNQELMRAAEWKFRAAGESDPIMSFVQEAVVLEILLGDKEASGEIGLGRLLANRCAYMLEKDAAKRRQLIDDVTAIYDTRSRIVHTGTTHLSELQRRQFIDLQYLTARIIFEEAVSLAKKDPSSESAT